MCIRDRAGTIACPSIGRDRRFFFNGLLRYPDSRSLAWELELVQDDDPPRAAAVPFNASLRSRGSYMLINPRALSVSFILTACATLSFLPEAFTAQPNIVFIISDDHDNEHLGFMGNKIGHTPNLDRLADSGTVFSLRGEYESCVRLC